MAFSLRMCLVSLWTPGRDKIRGGRESYAKIQKDQVAGLEIWLTRPATINRRLRCLQWSA